MNCHEHCLCSVQFSAIRDWVNQVLLHRPDYQGRGIFNLMVSLRNACDGGDERCQDLECELIDTAQLRDARHIMLLVIDGMGSVQLKAHCPHGALANACRGELTSVFPSTTASAITTYMSGDPPARHGLTGWHMWFRELGVVGAPLPFHERGSHNDLQQWGLGAPALFGTRSLLAQIRRRSFVIHPESLCGSAYTKAHSGPATVVGYKKLTDMLEQLARISRTSNRSYSYAYWPQLDALSHKYGSQSSRCAHHLQNLDQAIAGLAAQLRGTGTVLLVCADHGFIDTRPQTRIGLHDHPQLQQMLLLPLCGEPRTVFCYVRNGADDEFNSYLAQELPHACEVHRSTDLLDQGYLGPGPEHSALRSRLGSHTLLMKDNYCLYDRVANENQPFTLIGVHGGMSAAELQVPLISFGLD